MPGALTTVTICWTPVEAGLFQDALEAEGIRSFVRESNLGTIDPFVTPALGGIRVDVDTAHLDRARGIVAAVRATLSAPKKRGAGDDEEDLCPACGKPLPADDTSCATCGWALADGGEGEASTPRSSRTATWGPPVPGRLFASCVLACWTLCILLWQTADSVLRPTFPADIYRWDLTAFDIGVLLLGGGLLAWAGTMAWNRGFRHRVRPRMNVSGPIAVGLGLCLLAELTIRIFEGQGAFDWAGNTGWLLLPFLPPTLALAWPALRGAGIRRTRAALGLVRGEGFLREALLGVVAFPAIYAAQIACDWILRPDPPPYHPIDDWLLAGEPYLRAWGWAAVLVQTPITEELIFRGVLYRFFRDSSGVAVAVLASSLLFAIWHVQGWGAIPSLALFGAGAALLREWRGSLIAPMAMHAAAWAWILAHGYPPPV